MKNCAKYHWYFEPQNSRGGKLTNIGVKKDKIDISDIKWIGHNFKQYNESNENTVGCLIKSQNILVMSIHFPMAVDSRKSMIENFGKCLSHFIYNKLVICGDFNSFLNLWEYAQIPKMNNICGTYSVSEYAVNESDQKFAIKSFVPYPYDVVPIDVLKMVGKIDHILVSGMTQKHNTDVIVHDYISDAKIYPSDHFHISTTLVIDN